ncbi:TonB-dependent receptor, plug [Luminiphilus syltensis NOR5-1B]|uniref:TonB-dependent receptor, plug n=1 Tax=Luminiphilus syltensis NOR5-1B TaxID=565045 RepID=B8KVD7_9GAMM|nr:TonB-dependent receptor [Luminiphilus syltensis]EED35212.1 TonB-dependent receptor, plug [Luminiphilus syltensis NOR5-1B]
MAKTPSFERKPLSRFLSSHRLQAGLLAIPMSVVSTLSQAQLEEVVVTATRRSESVQDIPINIAAIGGTQIAQQGFDDLSELIAYVPGINVIDQGGRDGNRIVARGLNAEPVSNPFGQENGGGTVATYIGEVPFYVDLRLNDLERVEILLGPQGTLYGAGTMGGAIRYIPNKPDFEDTTISFRADGYSYSEGDGISSDIGVTFNLPLSDTFAIRGSIDRFDDKGFIDAPFIVSEPGVSNPDPDFSDPAERDANFDPIDDVNTEEILSGRVALRWQPNDYLDSTLTYYFQKTEHGGRNSTGFLSPIPAGKYESSTRVQEFNDRDSDLVALEIIADLGFAELTSSTGLGSVEEAGQRDQTDLLITLEYSYENFPTFTGFTAEDEETETLTQEFRLVSTSEGPLSWIVGAFYNRNEYEALSSEFTPGYGAFVNSPELDFGYRDDLNDLEYFSADRTRLEEMAFYGEVGYDITENWNVTIGARYYDYEFETGSSTDFPYFTTPETFQPYPLSEIGQNIDLEPNQEFDGDLFKVNTSYQLTDDANIYFTFSQGYRVGASNQGQPCDDVFVPGNQSLCLYAPGQQFGPNPGDIVEINERDYFPDTVDSFELGAKTVWLDGKLTLNGSIYFIDWQDPQVSSASINANTPITVNAGAAESKGLDVAGSWQVTDALSVRGSYSYNNAELTEDVASLVRSIQPPGFGTGFEDGQSGDRLPGTPENQFSVFASYVMMLGDGNELIFDAGYSWQDEVLSRTAGRGNSYTLDAFGRAMFNATYQTETWRLTAYVNNAFDDYSEASVVGTPDFNQTVAGANVRTFNANVLPPRTLGVRATIDF